MASLARSCGQHFVMIECLRPKKKCLFPVTLPKQVFTNKDPYPKVFFCTSNSKSTFENYIKHIFEQRNNPKTIYYMFKSLCACGCNKTIVFLKIILLFHEHQIKQSWIKRYNKNDSWTSLVALFSGELKIRKVCDMYLKISNGQFIVKCAIFIR